MSRPKFSVGEEVAVVGVIDPCYDTPKTEIVSCRWATSWHNGQETVLNSWGYQTDHISYQSGAWLLERCLRKLPPEERISWSDCAWQPKELSHDK